MAHKDKTLQQEMQHKPAPDDPRKPDSPTDLTKPSFTYTLKKTLREFTSDQCTDLAASLTYYTVLALFPGLLAIVSILGLVSNPRDTIDTLLDVVTNVGGGQVADSCATRSRARALPCGADHVHRRCARCAVVGVRLRRRLRPCDEPHLQRP